MNIKSMFHRYKEKLWNVQNKIFDYLFLCSKYEDMGTLKQVTYLMCNRCTHCNRNKCQHVISPAYMWYLRPVYIERLLHRDIWWPFQANQVLDFPNAIGCFAFFVFTLFSAHSELVAECNGRYCSNPIRFRST